MRKYLIEHLSSLQSRLARFACAIALLGAASVGCGAVTEQELTLAEQTLHYDLKLNLSIPPMFQGLKVTCSNGFIQCSALPGLLGLNTSYQVIGLCDDKTMLCAGDIKLLVLFAIDFSKDTAFTSGFAQSNADNIVFCGVHFMAIRSTTDPRAVYLGKVGPLPRKATITDAGNPLPVPDGSPAHSVFIGAVRDPSKPLNVLLAVTARYLSGDPVPSAGAIDVKLTPVVKMLKQE